MKTLLRNVGVLVSGDIRQPVLDADSLVLRDGVIVAVGRELDEDADTVIDARGTTVLPGLIDSHVHPVFGGFTPRQRTVDFLDSALNGGVTPAISAGEVHLPGRPRDIVGLKALADLVVCDAPTGSVARDALGALAIGDLPGISMVLVDGKTTIGRSRNTPPAARAGEILKGAGPTSGGH